MAHDASAPPKGASTSENIHGRGTVNCPRCQVVNAETSSFCTNCGSPLRAGSPAPGYPPASPAVPVAPLCMMCRSSYLQYFQNGKGICSVCKFIFRWGYTPTGQIVILPDAGLF